MTQPEPLKGKTSYYRERLINEDKIINVPFHLDKDIRSAVEWTNKKVYEFSFEHGLFKGHIDKGSVYMIIKQAFEDVMK